MTAFVVGTLDIRQALLSVVPHVEPDPEMSLFHRVRVGVGPVNVTVSATEGHTAAHAIVSLVDNEDGEFDVTFDLSPLDVKEILTLFKVAKADEGLGDTLRLNVDKDHVTITDVSGLFPGKALVLPRQADQDTYPDVPLMIACHMNAQFIGVDDRLVVTGPRLKAFALAAAAYGEPLVLEPTGLSAAFVVHCGESFVGLLMPIRQDDETRAQITAWRDAWITRLPSPANPIRLIKEPSS